MYYWIWLSSRPDLGNHLVASRDARNRATVALWRRLKSSVSRGVKAIEQERRHRRAVASLRALDDRMLRDLGIHRSEIVSVVERGGFRPASAHAAASVMPLTRPAASEAAMNDQDLPKAA